jgi:hypothetical protein
MRSSLAVVSVAFALLSGCGPSDAWFNTANLRYQISVGECEFASAWAVVRDNRSPNREVVALGFARELIGATFDVSEGKPNRLVVELREEFVDGATQRTSWLNGHTWDMSAHNVIVQGVDGAPSLYRVDLSTFDESVQWGPIEPDAYVLRCELEQAVFDTWGEIRRDLGVDSEVYATLEEYRAKYHSEDR